jgi:hypothetical protein
MARRHVREMEAIVVRQREIVSNLREALQPTDLAIETLARMEETLQLARDHLARSSI